MRPDRSRRSRALDVAALAISVFAFGLTGFAILVPPRAQAEEAEPNEFVPLPAGTNLLLGYYAYGDESAFKFAQGPTYTNKTGLQVNIGVAR